MFTAVFSDESVVDSHGDIVLLGGMDLSRYQANAVLLYQHQSFNVPVGKVHNLRVEGKQLVGEVEFADSDFAQELQALYQGGFMRAFSIGYAELGVREINGVKMVERSELYEISCVTLPANPNALRIENENYAAVTKFIKRPEDNKTYTLRHKAYKAEAVGAPASEPIDTNIFKNEETTMKLVTKTLNLPESTGEVEVVAAIEALQQKHLDAQQLIDTLQTKLVALETQSKAERATDLVQKAVADGKITKAQEAFWLETAQSDYEKAKAYLDGLDAYVPITARIKAQANTLQAKMADRTDWTFAQWQKEDSKGLKEMRETEPDAYKALVASIKR